MKIYNKYVKADIYVPAPLLAGSKSELVELGPPEAGNPILCMGADRGLSMGGSFLLRRRSTGPIPEDVTLVWWVFPLQLEPAATIAAAALVALPEPELELPADPAI